MSQIKPASEGETVVIPIVEETFDVQKRRAETGRVHITKVVREREELVDEPLLHEEVEVERVAINRVVDGPITARHEGDTLIIPVLEEVLVVEKRLVLKEELRITKRLIQAHKPQQVTLRSEAATVERINSQKPTANPPRKE
jgi:uncharacterized protein (TIGR02271 family)